MNVLRQCECCSGDGSEGKEWFIGAEGEDICARCAAELLGAERDSLRHELAGAVSEIERLRETLAHVINRVSTEGRDDEHGLIFTAGKAALDRTRGQ
jgi:superfamily II helicase